MAPVSGGLGAQVGQLGVQMGQLGAEKAQDPPKRATETNFEQILDNFLDKF